MLVSIRVSNCSQEINLFKSVFTERLRARRFGVILTTLSRENQFMNADIYK